jgi:uncharacterized cupin superfamily protein
MTKKYPSVIDEKTVTRSTGSIYPPPLNEQVKGRSRARLGDLFGLDQFGVNVVTLAPGAWSSHRHAHQTEDEFIYVTDGEITLGDDDGHHVMTAGMCAGFKAGTGNGHHLKNLSAAPASYIEIGSRYVKDDVTYLDVDMHAAKTDGTWKVTKKDGTAF